MTRLTIVNQGSSPLSKTPLPRPHPSITPAGWAATPTVRTSFPSTARAKTGNGIPRSYKNAPLLRPAPPPPDSPLRHTLAVPDSGA